MLWTFGKEKERISLGRLPGTCALIVTLGGEHEREYRFDEMARLDVFQADMEAFLLRTGWTLVEYSPERRHRHRDRRGFPRLRERRRWWTDPKERAKVVWGGRSPRT